VSAARASGIELSIAGGVAWITLTRPRRGNRIDAAAAQALCDATEAVEFDESVSVVVVRGNGKAFCLGIEDGGPWERRHDFVAAVAGLTRPVIAAVDGEAAAEGCELALACDLRLASRRARFRLPQLGDGRLPSHGGTQRLPRIVGRMRALDLLLSGRVVRAAEAAAMGLASRVVATARFTDELGKEVENLRQRGPVALRLAKEAVLKSFDLTLDQGIRLEQDLYVLLQTTADRAEGVRAFLEKRRPRFRGR